MSAGMSHDAETLVSVELIEWADMIFVMEKSHLTKLRTNFGEILSDKRVVCLNIPDKYKFMDQELVTILRDKVGVYLK